MVVAGILLAAGRRAEKMPAATTARQRAPL
jgi:hypothetical protein